MKVPAFTRDNHILDPDALLEHRVVSKKEWQKTRSYQKHKYKTKESYFSWGEYYVPHYFTLGKWLAEKFRELKCKNILSLGAGDGYIEYVIKKQYPQCHLIISDFDELLIARVKKLIPQTGTFCVIDIKKDNFQRFYGKVDTVLMVAVSYVLSDAEAVDFFKKLEKLKLKHIFIVAVAYLWPEDIFLYFISHYLGGDFISKTLHKLIGQKIPERPPGRFHGWTRSRGEFEKILKAAGSYRIDSVTRYKSRPRDIAVIDIVLKY